MVSEKKILEHLALQSVVNCVPNKWTFGGLLIKATVIMNFHWYVLKSFQKHCVFTHHKISVAFQNHFSWNVLSKMHYIYVFETIQFLKHIQKRIIVSCDRNMFFSKCFWKCFSLHLNVCWFLKHFKLKHIKNGFRVNPALNC